MAQPGIPSRIFGRARLLSFVALQSHLRHWTQLGTCENHQQLSSLGSKNMNAVFTAIDRCLALNELLLLTDLVL
jgi:hypothetical protein